MDCSTSGFAVLHHLLEFAQIHVHWIGDAIQPSHPLLPPSLPALILSQRWLPKSHLFASCGQSIGASASAAVLPMNIQGWFPLGTLVAAQAAKKGGGHLAALSWPNLWLSCCVGLFKGTLCNKSLVFWNWMIRTCKKFKLCGGVIQHKTKPNQAPSVWHREVSILKACFPSTVAFYQEVCGIFFFF